MGEEYLEILKVLTKNCSKKLNIKKKRRRYLLKIIYKIIEREISSVFLAK